MKELRTFFRRLQIVPGGNSGNVSVYEDDGATTAYLTDNMYAWTASNAMIQAWQAQQPLGSHLQTAAYTTITGVSTTVTISTTGSYPVCLS
jgi:hypothetical protein